MSIVLRDQFILEMEDTLKETVGLGFQNGKKWEQCYSMQSTDKRRVEVDQFVHPSVIAITKEGAALNRYTVRRGYNSYVIPDTLSGEIKVSHEFIRDNRFPEIEKGAFGLGKAMARKRYKDAMSYFYNGFSTVIAPDGQPVFSSNHVLINGQAGQTGDNLLVSSLSTDSFDSAVTKLLETVDENGDVLPMDIDKLQLIIPSRLKRIAKQITGSEKEPENMNNAINIYSKQEKEYDIQVIDLPLLVEGPAAYRYSHWYLREVSMAENTFYEREAPDSWMIKDLNSFGVLHQCKDAYGIVWHDWRGVVASKGLM